MRFCPGCTRCWNFWFGSGSDTLGIEGNIGQLPPSPRALKRCNTQKLVNRNCLEFGSVLIVSADFVDTAEWRIYCLGHGGWRWSTVLRTILCRKFYCRIIDFCSGCHFYLPTSSPKPVCQLQTFR